MRLKIILDTIEEFNEVRSLLDKANVASYPQYGIDEKSLNWHKPILVAVGTSNSIYYVEHYVLKGRNVKMEEEKGYWGGETLPIFSRTMKIETIEIAGIAGALTALRLPFGKDVRSHIDGYYKYDKSGTNMYQIKDGMLSPFIKGKNLYARITWISKLDDLKSAEYFLPTWYGCSIVQVNTKDLTLMQTLVKRGDEHAKVVRGIIVWAKITAPVYWWAEEETYRAGHERLASESTMHIDCKGLSGKELQEAKAAIPMGKELTKVDMFSYQTLRRIVAQRHNHRPPEWHTFIDWVKTLPFAEELILVGLEMEE